MHRDSGTSHRPALSRRGFLKAGAAAGLASLAFTRPALAAPGPGGTPPTVVRQMKGITAGLTQEIIQLDPHIITATVDSNIARCCYSGLTIWDKNMNVIPDLAESWTNPDPKTWLFNIRRGVKFHNGRDMTAEDVKYSIDRIIELGSRGKYASYIVDVESVDVVENYQVRVNMKAASAPLLDNLVYCVIVPRESVPDDGLSKAPVGTGPFKFVERIPNQRVVVEKFGDYWKKDVNYADQISFVPATEEQTALANLRTGAIDYLDNVPFKAMSDLQSELDIKLASPNPGSTSYTWTLMKNTEPPFNKPEMRLAVAYGIDRDTLLRTVLFGAGEAHWNPYPKQHWAHAADIDGPTYDPDRAKRYLEAAGYAGEEINYKIFTTTWYPQFCQLVQVMLKDIGLNIKITQLEFATWIAEVYQKHDFQLAQTSVTREWDPDGMAISCLYTKGSNNPGEYSSAEMDAAFDRGRQTTDRDQRKAAYRDVQRLYAQDQPHVKAVNINGASGYNSRRISYFERGPVLPHWREIIMA